jgi:hypothetical protein
MVEVTLGDVAAEVHPNRILLNVGALGYFSWEEWRAFAERVEQSIRWVEANTPEGVTVAATDEDPS